MALNSLMSCRTRVFGHSAGNSVMLRMTTTWDLCGYGELIGWVNAFHSFALIHEQSTISNLMQTVFVETISNLFKTTEYAFVRDWNVSTMDTLGFETADFFFWTRFGWPPRTPLSTILSIWPTAIQLVYVAEDPRRILKDCFMLAI